MELSVQTFFQQIYGLPVETPQSLPVPGVGLYGDFISFEEAANLLSQNLISQVNLDALLQPWAGPPGTPNRVLTLVGTDGRVLFVKAQYDLTTNQIFPPL